MNNRKSKVIGIIILVIMIVTVSSCFLGGAAVKELYGKYAIGTAKLTAEDKANIIFANNVYKAIKDLNSTQLETLKIKEDKDGSDTLRIVKSDEYIDISKIPGAPSIPAKYMKVNYKWSVSKKMSYNMLDMEFRKDPACPATYEHRNLKFYGFLDDTLISSAIVRIAYRYQNQNQDNSETYIAKEVEKISGFTP